jgi:predicted TPR repeat methyltransferase
MPDPIASDTFEQARQCFMQGLACLQAQRFEEAEGHFLASLDIVPGRPSTLVNLAAVRLAMGRHGQALEAADAALAVEPGSADAWLHRATALGCMQRLDEAVQGFERALAIDDRQSETWLRHAQALHALGRHDEALAAYQRVLALDPSRGAAWARMGDILREQNRLTESAHAFEQALAHGADDELTRFFFAAVTQARAPAHAPHAYVRALFDGYASDFDAHLVGTLGYQAHRVLVGMVQPLAPPSAFDSVLDLGCGTGLCGPLVRPLAKRLVGVDLSAPMLEKAKALQVYDDLVQADAVEHLTNTPITHRHDLVLAADVLIYLGELTPLFTALAHATRPGALFGFTVELPEHAGADVELMPSLRYAHSEAYLRRVSAKYGFSVVSARREPLRQDQRVPIDGLYMLVQRV